MSLVLDNSVAMLWLLPQSNPAGVPVAEKVLAGLLSGRGHVPSLWALEAANVIARSQRQDKVTQAQASEFISLLDELDLDVDPATAQHALHETLELARQFGLSAYDAAYLELALRKGLPLATLDAKLLAAAEKAGVLVF
jgi:predicted nucleic acid-binding protein